MGAIPYLDVWRLRHDGGFTEEQLPDQLAADLIKRASRLIDDWTGWFFEPRMKTFRLDGNGRDMIDLPVPVIRLESVKVDGQDIPLSRIVVYSQDDDRFDPRMYNGWGWPKGRQNIVIEGEFGFVEDDGSPPEAIQTACMMLVEWLMKSPDERRRVSQESGEGAQIIYEKDYRFAGFTGDRDIDSLLIQYARPLAMGMV